MSFSSSAWFASLPRLVVKLWRSVRQQPWDVGMAAGTSSSRRGVLGGGCPWPPQEDSRVFSPKTDVPGIFHWFSHEILKLGTLHGFHGGSYRFGFSCWIFGKVGIIPAPSQGQHRIFSPRTGGVAVSFSGLAWLVLFWDKSWSCEVGLLFPWQ